MFRAAFCILEYFFNLHKEEMFKMGIEFDQAYEEWMNSLLEKERNRRVRSRIENGLEHGTLEFLHTVRFPVVKKSRCTPF